jgi:hypothetical protein
MLVLVDDAAQSVTSTDEVGDRVWIGDRFRQRVQGVWRSRSPGETGARCNAARTGAGRAVGASGPDQHPVQQFAATALDLMPSA